MMGRKNRNRKDIDARATIKVLAVMLCALAVFIATIVASSRFARTRLIHQSDEIARLQNEIISDNISDIFQGSAWTVVSFAAAISYYDSLKYFRIPGDILSELNEESLYRMLERYLTINFEYHSAGFIFEPGIIKGAAEGLVAEVHTGEGQSLTRVHRIPADYYSTDNYKKGSSGNETFYATADPVVNCDSLVSSSFILPFYDTEGKFLGELWANSRKSYSTDLLQGLKPYHNASILILNENKVISSTYAPAIGKSAEELRNAFQVTDLKEEGDGSISRSRAIYDKQKCTIYTFDVPICNYVIVTVLSDKDLFRDINTFERIFLVTSILGLILIVLCIGYAFRKYKQTSDSNLRMETDLRISAEIQQHFLPTAGISHEGLDVYGLSRAATEVGGDLYDRILRDGKLIFCIGDVSGKGVSAALFMSRAISHFRNLAKSFDDPERIISNVNTALCDRNSTLMFCTMIIGVMDIESGLVRFCNAGHDRPLLISPEGSRFIDMNPGLPLGIDDGYKFETESLTLRQNEKFIIYTDGITEARNTDKVLFKESGLLAEARRLSAKDCSEAIVSSIVDAVDAFAGESEQSDDITILCIGRI